MIVRLSGVSSYERIHRQYSAEVSTCSSFESSCKVPWLLMLGHSAVGIRVSARADDTHNCGCLEDTADEFILGLSPPESSWLD